MWCFKKASITWVLFTHVRGNTSSHLESRLVWWRVAHSGLTKWRHFLSWWRRGEGKFQSRRKASVWFPVSEKSIFLMIFHTNILWVLLARLSKKVSSVTLQESPRLVVEMDRRSGDSHSFHNDSPTTSQHIVSYARLSVSITSTAWNFANFSPWGQMIPCVEGSSRVVGSLCIVCSPL